MTQEIIKVLQQDRNYWRADKRKKVLKHFLEGKDVKETVKVMKSNYAFVVGVTRHPAFLRKISDFILATQLHKVVVQTKEIEALENTLESDLKMMEPADRIKELNKLLGDKSYEKLSEPIINLFIKIGEEKRKQAEPPEEKKDAKKFFKFEESEITDDEQKQITEANSPGMADGQSDQDEQGPSD
jgi:hypothetical protein